MNYSNKKSIRKTILMAFLFAISMILLFAFAGCKDSKYFIEVNWNEVEVGEKNTIHVEYGETITVPSGIVTDNSGEEFDVVVTHKLVDSTGKDITARIPIYTLAHGMTYTLTYHAESTEVEIKDLIYTIECSDTVAPNVTVSGFRAMYNVGDTVEFTVSNVTDASGYKEDSIKLSVKHVGSNQEIALTDDSFVIEQAGEYQLIVQAEDNVGNKLNDIKTFKAAELYQEPAVDNVLWGFDSDNAYSNLSALSDSDTFMYDITDEKVENSGKSLKLSLEANTTANFLLNNGNSTPIVEMEYVEFRVYATNLIDRFSIYTSDYTEINFDYRILKNQWLTIKFNPTQYYAETASIDSLNIKIWVEEDAELYIDGVYYSDKILPWQDPTLAPQVIADFDEIEYADRLGPLNSLNNSSYGGVATIHVAGDAEVPTGANGGVLKLASTSICSQTEDKTKARDGFYYDCAGKVSLDEIEAFYFRINYDNYQYLSLHFALVTDMGTQYYWKSLPAPGTGFEYLVITKEEMLNADYTCLDPDASYFTGFYIRMYKATDNTVNTYFDEIGYITAADAAKPFNSGNYEFESYAELMHVSAFGSASYSMYKDGDRGVLKVNTAYNATESGLNIAFNNLDVSRYERIKVTLKAPTGTNLNINGTYVEYKTYTDYAELDLKALAEENGFETLSSFGVGRKTTVTNMYIDKIEFIEKSDSYNYDFSNADDPDKNAAMSFNDGIIEGIVADTDAIDGFALHAVTGLNMSTISGVKIIFNDINVTDYTKIIVRLKTDNGVGFYANGEYLGDALWNSYPTYTEVDIKPYLTTLNSLEIGRQSLDGINIWVDCITFVGVFDDITYQFSSTDTTDMKAVEGYGETTPAVVVDSTAYDGFALSVAGSVANKGLTIKFSHVDMSKVYQLRMRIKTTGNVQLVMNGENITTLSYANYTEVDLVALYESAKGQILANLDTVTLYLIDATGGTISVDYLSFFNYGETVTLYNADLHGDEPWTANYGAPLAVEEVSGKKGLKIVGNGAWTAKHDQYVYTLSLPMDLSVISSVRIHFYTTSGSCTFEAPLGANYKNFASGETQNTWQTTTIGIPTATNAQESGTLTDFNFLNTAENTKYVYIHSIQVILNNAN